MVVVRTANNVNNVLILINSILDQKFSGCYKIKIIQNKHFLFLKTTSENKLEKSFIQE